MKYRKLQLCLLVILGACSPKSDNSIADESTTDLFQQDVEFLNKFTPVVVLENSSGDGKVAVSPALQGRVMTSSTNGASYGWINRKLFQSGDTSSHINAFGGEERLWLGPEGGQFSIFFEKGVEFNLDNWYTPRIIDLDPFEVVSSSKNKISFRKDASLKNYSGTTFQISIEREVEVLDEEQAQSILNVDNQPGVTMVAYKTNNSVKNISADSWSKKTGILSIWMLGMLNHSATTTIVVPFKKGDEKLLGPILKDDYFGIIPGDRLIVGDGVIYFKADGEFRSKIGLSPLRATNRIGSYDFATNTLTILQFEKPEGIADYVNAAWEIQKEPFKGDVINSYNDGPPSPGVASMGPFYELESSSPAVELKPNEKITHTQTTFHFQGDKDAINRLAEKLLGVSTQDIKESFNK